MQRQSTRPATSASSKPVPQLPRSIHPRLPTPRVNQSPDTFGQKSSPRLPTPRANHSPNNVSSSIPPGVKRKVGSETQQVGGRGHTASEAQQGMARVVPTESRSSRVPQYDLTIRPWFHQVGDGDGSAAVRDLTANVFREGPVKGDGKQVGKQDGKTVSSSFTAGILPFALGKGIVLRVNTTTPRRGMQEGMQDWWRGGSRYK